MILCDIGNSYFHFYEEGRIWQEELKSLKPKRGEIFYISVNPWGEQRLLSENPQAIDLAPYFALKHSYVGLGIDRIAACEDVFGGLVVDAGTAITLDVVEAGVHLGGCILPGIASYLRSYADISPRLALMPDFSIDLSLLPQDTRQALGYGILKSVLSLISQMGQGRKIYFCGGDGKFFSKFFQESLYDGTLVFRGMQRALQRYREQV